MKFLSASETLERVDENTVTRDTREMETLIQTEKEMHQALSDILRKDGTQEIFGLFTREWNFFEQDNFIVSLNFLQKE